MINTWFRIEFFVGGYFTWTLNSLSIDHIQDYTVVYISLYQCTVDIILMLAFISFMNSYPSSKEHKIWYNTVVYIPFKMVLDTSMLWQTKQQNQV